MKPLLGRFPQGPRQPTDVTSLITTPWLALYPGHLAQSGHVTKFEQAKNKYQEAKLSCSTLSEALRGSVKHYHSELNQPLQLQSNLRGTFHGTFSAYTPARLTKAIAIMQQQ